MAFRYEYARYMALVEARIFALGVQKSHVISVNALVSTSLVVGMEARRRMDSTPILVVIMQTLGPTSYIAIDIVADQAIRFEEGLPLVQTLASFKIGSLLDQGLKELLQGFHDHLQLSTKILFLSSPTLILLSLHAYTLKIPSFRAHLKSYQHPF